MTGRRRAPTSAETNYAYRTPVEVLPADGVLAPVLVQPGDLFARELLRRPGVSWGEV